MYYSLQRNHGVMVSMVNCCPTDSGSNSGYTIFLIFFLPKCNKNWVNMCPSYQGNVKIFLLDFRSLFAQFCTGLIYTVFSQVTVQPFSIKPGINP